MAKHAAMSSGSTGDDTKWNYDVFLSFRGEDTRKGFTDHLSKALDRKGIKFFKDDEKLKKGEEINPALLKAIQESRISIVVFSENYAESRWCLDELVEILECKKDKNQLVWPIFYKVEPTDVRKQTNSYGEAMAKHEKRLGIDSVKKWRLALFAASNIAGFNYKGSKFQSKADFVEQIAKEVYAKVVPKDLAINEHIVGLKSRVEEVKSRLDLKSNDTTRMLGIHGTGGIGKTTLAQVVYNSIHNQFEGASFLLHVREISKQSVEGIKHLQQTLLSEILEESIQFSNDRIGTNVMKPRLGRKRVLIVLDDVDDEEQLNKLAGAHDWFGSGSRIIITTRDKHLLETHGVDTTYEMKVLNDRESRDLFHWHAFKFNDDNHAPTNYEDLSNRAICYCKGLPLALKVIGSLMYMQSLKYCEDILDQCEMHPTERIQRILRISYDHLQTDNEKNIFLDIACFFKGQRLEYIQKIWEACDFYPEVGLKNLVDKSLITIEFDTLRMHDLIQDMGREVVWKEASSEDERSRLWLHEDIHEVLTEDIGSGKIEGIMLDPPQREEFNWIDTAFKSMRRLRILIVQNTSFSSGPKYLPNNLKVIDWKEYPSESFPPDFYPKKIVAINLRGSPLIQLETFKEFKHLTYMDLSYCQSITQIPDVSKAQNIRKLRLDRCEKLVWVHGSVGTLPKLVYLSASKCTQLRSFVPRINLPSLEYLSFNLCRNLEHFPEVDPEADQEAGQKDNMNKPTLKISMIDTAIKMLPHSIGNLTRLESLEMTGCTGLQDVPASLFDLPKFLTLKIGGCSRLRESFRSFGGSHSLAESRPNLTILHFGKAGLSDEDVHAVIHSFPHLKDLDVSWNNFVSLPAHIEGSVYLKTLDVKYCRKLQEIPELPSSVQKVDARHCYSLSSNSSSMLWSQVGKEKDRIEILMPRTEIPEWFDHRHQGGVPVFKVRRKFPVVALAFVFEEVKNAMAKGPLPIHWRSVGLHLFIGDDRVPRRHYHNFIIDEHHVILCDLRVLFCNEEWKGLDAHVGDDDDWKTVHVECETDLMLSEWGVYVYNKQETNMDDIQFDQFMSLYPNPSSRNLVSRSKEEKVSNNIENLNLPEIFEGSLLEGKVLEESGNFEGMPPSFIESHHTVVEALERISMRVKALQEGKAQGDEDEDHETDALLQWMEGIISQDEKEEERSAAGPSNIEREYDEVPPDLNPIAPPQLQPHPHLDHRH